jgi:hypothetical protein
MDSLGISINRSICMNDYFSSTHSDMTMQEVISTPNDTIRTNALKIVPRVLGGTSSTNLIILDVDSLLAALVGAVRRRVQITRQIFPMAKLALYDEHAQKNETVMDGYRRAAKLGLWDDVDYMIPVLYLPAHANAARASSWTEDILTCTADAKRRSDGAAIPMAPLMSWLFYPSKCAVPYDSIRAVVSTIDRLSALLESPIPIVHLWSGSDNETSARLDESNRSCAVEPIYQRVWLDNAHTVPDRCLHASRGRSI